MSLWMRLRSRRNFSELAGGLGGQRALPEQKRSFEITGEEI